MPKVRLKQLATEGASTGEVVSWDGSKWAPGTDSSAIHKATASEISAITGKPEPTALDLVLIEDSDASNAKKSVQLRAVNRCAPITWVSKANVTASIGDRGTDLTKSGGTGGAWDAGARSLEMIPGDGYVEFVAAATNKRLICGLGSINSNASYTDVDYGLYLHNDGTLRVYESGVNRTTTPSSPTYAARDVLRVEKVGSTVTYSRNGTTIYTSSVSSNDPVYVDCSLSDSSAQIGSVRMWPESYQEEYHTWDGEGSSTENTSSYDTITTLTFTPAYANCSWMVEWAAKGTHGSTDLFGYIQANVDSGTIYTPTGHYFHVDSVPHMFGGMFKLEGLSASSHTVDIEAMTEGDAFTVDDIFIRARVLM